MRAKHKMRGSRTCSSLARRPLSIHNDNIDSVLRVLTPVAGLQSAPASQPQQQSEWLASWRRSISLAGIPAGCVPAWVCLCPEVFRLILRHIVRHLQCSSIFLPPSYSIPWPTSFPAAAQSRGISQRPVPVSPCEAVRPQDDPHKASRCYRHSNTVIFSFKERTAPKKQ